MLNRTIFHESDPCSAGREAGSRDWAKVCGIRNPFILGSIPALGIPPTIVVGQGLIARDGPFRDPNPLGRWFFGFRKGYVLLPRGGELGRVDVGGQRAGIGKPSAWIDTCILNDSVRDDCV